MYLFNGSDVQSPDGLGHQHQTWVMADFPAKDHLLLVAS